MNTAVLNVKVNPDTKKEAQKVAAELGMSLSAIINGFLSHLVRTKTITFSTREVPSQYLLDALKEAKEDVKAGKVSPKFTTAKDSIRWLNDPNATYQNGDRV